MSYIFTQETPEALPAINAVLESSITAWNLSDRLYRLSVNAYRYSESDWIDHQFYGLRDQNNTLLAILVLNDDASELPGDQSCLQIHGLYVHSDSRHQGLGQHLVDHAITLATTRQLNALFVKAHESAVPFFTKLQFQHIPVVDEIRDYPYRLVRSVM
ncbi:MAG: GNAT family N-acetyltransferase [Gammaproteobacteria bacterium]|jgi:GNAT superfamily N-acetyltransferase|nr:GNAT family N-acetyltransferase [Gammaproteobacteria bacterium]